MTVDLSVVDPGMLSAQMMQGSAVGMIDVSGNGGTGDQLLVDSLAVDRLGAMDLYVNEDTGSGNLQLLIRGDDNDSVLLKDGSHWQDAGTTSIDGEQFRILNDENHRQLLIGVKIDDPNQP